MPAVRHVWVARAKCECGYIWTTPGAPSVVCACRARRFHNGEMVGEPSLPFDDAEFTQAVADDLGVDVAELELLHGEH